MCIPSCWTFLLGYKYDNPFFVCSYVATVGCLVRKPLFVDVKLATFSKTLRPWDLDMGPSLQFSSVILLKRLLLNLNLNDCESWQHKLLLHRQITSVQRNSYLIRPGSGLSCSSCLGQQVQGKKFLIDLLENSSVQSPLRKEFQFLSLLVGYKHTNRARMMLDRASLHRYLAHQRL